MKHTQGVSPEVTTKMTVGHGTEHAGKKIHFCSQMLFFTDVLSFPLSVSWSPSWAMAQHCTAAAPSTFSGHSRSRMVQISPNSAQLQSCNLSGRGYYLKSWVWMGEEHDLSFYYFALRPKQLGDILDPHPHVLSPFPKRTAMQKSRSTADTGRVGSSVGYTLTKSASPLHFLLS